MQTKLLDNFTNIFLALLFSFSIAYGSISSLGLGFPALLILLMISICLLILYFVFINRMTIIFSSILFSLLIVVSSLSLLFTVRLPSILSFLDNYFYWLTDFITYGGVSDRLFANITVISICVLCSVYFFIFVYKKFGFLFLLIPCALIFVIQWSFDFVYTLLPFYIFLFSILIAYIKHININKVKSGPNDFLSNSYFLFWAIPIVVVILLSSFIIKANEKPLEWKWLNEKVNTIYTNIASKYDKRVFDYFSVAKSGFGDKSGILGGRVKLDNALALTVETDKNIYLKGNSYDLYDGVKWANSLTGKISLTGQFDPLYSSIVEIKNGMPLLTDKKTFIDDFFYYTKTTVVYQNITCKSVFLPPLINYFIPSKKDAGTHFIFEENETLSSVERKSRGFVYSFDLYITKNNNKEFINALRKSKKGLYKENLFVDGKISDKYESLMNISNNVYSKYLQIPETLPQRVKELALSITSKYSNNYDKVKALEQYLAENYAYNLDVRPAPRGRDFVDYFLFDLKEGYCTYYATALTVLARCVGIPTRYVEGYNLPPKPIEKNYKLYYVTNQQAHAWTEVYFEGYGWLPFEATSPFRARFYADPDASTLYSSSFSNNSTYSDYLEMLKEFGGDSDVVQVEPAISNDIKVDYSKYILLMISILLFVLISFILYINIRIKIRIFKITLLPPKECVLGMYKYFLSVLDVQNCAIGTNETPSRFAYRIDRFLYFSPVKFSVITEIFIKARYSNEEISEKEKKILCDFRRNMMSATSMNIGKLRFFFIRNILGKI